MPRTFATHGAAAIFASAMRSHGYCAEVLDQAMGLIYSPLSIGGIRVMVSDETIGNEHGSDDADFTTQPLTISVMLGLGYARECSQSRAER